MTTVLLEDRDDQDLRAEAVSGGGADHRGEPLDGVEPRQLRRGRLERLQPRSASRLGWIASRELRPSRSRNALDAATFPHMLIYADFCCLSSESCYGSGCPAVEDPPDPGAVISNTPPPTTHPSVGAVLRTIRETGPTTRAELVGGHRTLAIHARRSGSTRSWIRAHQSRATRCRSNGGRPRSTVELNTGGGVLLVADVEATRTRLALLDLVAAPLGEASEAIAVTDGPAAVLEADRARLRAPPARGGPRGPRTFAASASASPGRSPSPPGRRCSRR